MGYPSSRGMAAATVWGTTDVSRPWMQMRWTCVRAWDFAATPEAGRDALVAAYLDGLRARSAAPGTEVSGMKLVVKLHRVRPADGAGSPPEY